MSWLKGKKSYLCALGLGLVVVLHQLGVLSDSLYQTIVGILGAGGLAALRSGMKNA